MDNGLVIQFFLTLGAHAVKTLVANDEGTVETTRLVGRLAEEAEVDGDGPDDVIVYFPSWKLDKEYQ